MTICYFGFYNPGYSRNKILINGLRQNSVNIIECQSDSKGVKKYINLIMKHRKIKKMYDILIVGFPGYQATILAKILTKKPIIFDAFTSLYDSMILDRQLAGPISLKALYYWFLDWLSCALADKILLDTQANIEYFAKTFRIKRDKFIRVFVGSDDKVLYPEKKEKNNDYFLVHFHGTFIPLQGIEYIIKAANLLEKENVKFNIVGNGQAYKQIIQLASKLNVKNINFIDVIPYEKLKDYMNKADICLGIFGNTPKAQRVIPNKVYEALAAGCPTITEKSPAAEELFKDRENILFCKMANAEDLANKILELKNNPSLREKIARNGYQLFQEKLTPKRIAADLLEKLK